MLKENWIVVKRLIIAIGVLLGFFAFIEVIRAFQTLYAIHPWAGYVFVLILLAGIVWFFVYVFKEIFARPRVLRPPGFKNVKKPTLAELQRYGKYLLHYVERLDNNPSLEHSGEHKETIEKLNQTLNSKKDTQSLQEAIEQVEKEVVRPLLKELDEAAEKEVRKCVRDVMASVTFIPYKSIDLFIVLYRNFSMLVRIVKIYNAQPRFREQGRILVDTLKVVATVNYFAMGRNLLEGLGSKVPGIGNFVDDIAQGTGAGFMTSICGHAAIERCRAFRGWNEKEAKERLRDNISDFYGDVKDLFKKDFLPMILGRVAHTSKDTYDKVASVLDETGNSIGNFFKGAFKRKNGAS